MAIGTRNAAACTRGAIWHLPLLIAAGALLATTGAFAQVTYSPAQIRNAYGFNELPSNVTGSGQTIGIIDFGDDPYIGTDLAAFDNDFNISAPPSLTIENEFGSTSSLPGTADANEIAETSLDVEYAHAIAPGAKLDLIEVPPSPSFDDIGAAANTAAGQASVVSMSFGLVNGLGSPAAEAAIDPSFDHSGVAYIASSGDGGIWQYPASSPYVIGVGGTSLTINGGVNNGDLNASGGSYGGETVWINGYGSSGGGVDPNETIPSYQIGIASGPNRNVPDVSFDADPYTGVDFVYEGVEYGGVGGTSVGPPNWAGLLALADQLRASQDLPALSSTDALTMIYDASNDPTLYSELFNDITTGENAYGDTATVGYDDVTGLGTPIANNLVLYLADLPIPEPGSFALIAVTMLGAAAWRPVRRQTH